MVLPHTQGFLQKERQQQLSREDFAWSTRGTAQGGEKVRNYSVKSDSVTVVSVSSSEEYG